MATTILHVDMDAFFAAIEQRDDPSLRGLPVVVGADPQGGRGRGVVSTCSYEARRFGIHSAMPISTAYRLCPQAHYLPPRGAAYSRSSRSIFGILRSFTDRVEPLSIDEAFLDLAGCERLFGPPLEVARRIKERILEREQLTCSIGIARNKFLAKVASDLRKPDGLVVVEEGREEQFLRDLPVTRLWGVGPKTAARLQSQGLRKIGQIVALPLRSLEQLFGEHGAHLARLARGIDQRQVLEGGPPKSQGRERTFDHDTADPAFLERTLLGLSEEVAAKLRQEGLSGRTAVLKIRFVPFETHTRQVRLPRPSDTTEAIFPPVRALLLEALADRRKVRLIGVTVTQFTATAQLDLFAERSIKQRKLARAYDAITQRFGPEALRRAALLAPRPRRGKKR
jgi:nucleotidyltransferase/DNA polymerase involved in DNA repair